MKIDFIKLQSTFYFGIVLAIVIVAYLFYRKLTKPAAGSEETQAENLQKDLSSSNEKPSFDNSQYDILADKIQAAMEDFGTDEEAIYHVFNIMENNADLLKLQLAWGKRWVGGFFHNSSLSDALQLEMDAAEISEINSILTSKNISIKF